MRLLRLELENFRCFSKTTIELADLTVFVGPNDAGKSTILDAVRFLFHDRSRDGVPWERKDVAAAARIDEDSLEYVLAGDERDLEADADAPVTVVGVLGDLSETERSSLEGLIVDDLVRVGAFMPGWDGVRFGGRVGPWYVLPSRLDIADRYIEKSHRFLWRHGEEIWWDGKTFGRGSGKLAERFGLDPPTLPALVEFPGPDEPPRRAEELLEPLILQRAAHMVSVPQARTMQGERAPDVVREVGTKLSAILPAFLADAHDAVLLHRPGSWADVLRALVGSYEIYVRRRSSLAEIPDGSDAELPPGSEPLDALGAGARRAVALAVIALYADPTLWSPEQPAILLLEEPEVGLHPAAQRRVARSLRSLRTRFGLQALIVTHSATIIDAADPSGIRLVQPVPEADPRVLEPAGLQEIAEAIGARPSDVLLGSGFVVVEGKSDAEILGAWARKLGMPLGQRLVHLVPAGSWSKAAVVASLLDVVYPGALLTVVLDAGTEPADESDRLRRRYGKRVRVRQLPFPEIERCFSRRAVAGWLAEDGADPALAETFPPHDDDPHGATRELKRLSGIARRRGYRKVEDGIAIAELMDESEIPIAVRELLLGLAATLDSGTTQPSD